MILADENIDAHIVSILRSKNIEVFHIKEVHLNYPFNVQTKKDRHS